MKKPGTNKQFLKKLMETTKSLKDMKPTEVHVLSINANYGHYQIVIGPERNDGERKSAHARQIEINGEIHHIFVSPSAIRPQPSRHQMINNLKDTVIMRDLKIHIVDPEGDGEHLADRNADDDVLAREYINLAGARGEEIRRAVEHTRRLAMAAYKIAQEDILRSLKERKEETSRH